MKLFVKKLTPDAILPSKKRDTDEGYDIFASEAVVLKKGAVTPVKTGIAAMCEEGYWLQVEGRSGLAIKGIQPLGGIVDYGYTGEILVMLMNLSDESKTINIGDKIAQLVIRQHFNATIEEINEFQQTDRGSKGFGSSGNQA